MYRPFSIALSSFQAALVSLCIQCPLTPAAATPDLAAIGESVVQVFAEIE
jgi:hypothetical protein